MLDLRDVIYHPERYTVDRKSLLSASLILRTLDGEVVVHRYDHGLQEKRIEAADGVQTCRLCRGQGRAGSDTCPACNGTSIDALGVQSGSPTTSAKE